MRYPCSYHLLSTSLSVLAGPERCRVLNARSGWCVGTACGAVAGIDTTVGNTVDSMAGNTVDPTVGNSVDTTVSISVGTEADLTDIPADSRISLTDFETRDQAGDRAPIGTVSALFFLEQIRHKYDSQSHITALA